MATATVNLSDWRYSINGGGWQQGSGHDVSIGRTSGGDVFRGYISFSLSTYGASYILNNSSFTFTRADNYGNITWSIGLRASAPPTNFSAADFSDSLGDVSTTSNQTKSVTIPASAISKYKGATVYVCILGYGSGYSYGDIETDTSGKLPVLTVDYTYATSTMTASGSTIGSAMTFNITRNSSSFTHTITYSAGGQSGTVVTKTTGTSVSWTPPMALCSVNTTGTSVSCTFTLTTYNGSTAVGTSTLTVSLSIPSSVVPTIASDAVTLTAVSDNATVNSWGAYLKGYSKVRATWNTSKVSGAYGSTISSYTMTVAGSNYTGTTATSGVLNSSGSVTVSLKVTDSRGRSATQNKAITVVQYQEPYISEWTAFRSNSSGTSTDGGAYIRIKATLVKTDVGSNTGTITVRWKKASASSYTNSQTISNNTYVTINAGLEEASTYNVQVIPSDSLRTGPDVSTVLAAKREDILMDHNGTNLSLGIGKAPEGTNVIDIALLARFRSWSYHHGTVVWLDQNNNNRLYIQGDGSIYDYDANGKLRYFLDSATGNIRGYDTNGQERFGFYPAEGQISLYNSSGTRNVQIRGDGVASGSPLPVNQGGTGKTDSTLPYRSLTSAPTDTACGYFFRVTQAFTVYDENTSNNLTIPNYSHGIFVASTDAVMVCVDNYRNLYICYRNNGTWRGRKL